MNKLLPGILVAVAIGAVAGSIIIGAGIIDAGADTPHGPLIHQALAFARERSIARRIADLKEPEDFTEPERIRRGAGNYAAMCVNCHLAPELPDSEIRKGMYPAPPNLAARPDLTPARNAVRDFWIIKHGIKSTGMPAWSKGGMEDAVIWDLAAFLQRLPQLSKDDYDLLVTASDGHSHGGLAGDAHGHDEQATDHRTPEPAPAVNSANDAQKKQNHDDGAHEHDDHEH
jgi:hypothetical protein